MINQIISHQKSNLFLNFANIKGCRSGTCGILKCNLRRVHTLLVASCSERNLTGWRTQSDRVADGNRSGGGRNLIGWRTETSGDVPPTDAPTKQTERVSHRIRGTHRTFWQRKPPTDRHRCHRLGGYGIPAIPTPPITQPNHLWKSVKSVGRILPRWCSCLCSTNKADRESVPQNTLNTQNLLAEKASHR